MGFIKGDIKSSDYHNLITLGLAGNERIPVVFPFLHNRILQPEALNPTDQWEALSALNPEPLNPKPLSPKNSVFV